MQVTMKTEIAPLLFENILLGGEYGMKLEIARKCDDLCDDIVVCDNCENEVCDEICEEVQRQCLAICAEHLETSST
jgi:hypothetical protein